jgi:hypothetical protein
MASHTNMSFLKVDCDIEPLLKANEKGNHKKLIINKLADIASKNKLDAIIFVKREWFYEPILHNVDVSGYGVCKQVEMASMYLVAHATIYDASTMESLARFSLIANKQVDKSYFTKDIHQLSDEQRNDIKTWVKTSIKEEIIEGLRKYGLLPNPDKPSQ